MPQAPYSGGCIMQDAFAPRGYCTPIRFTLQDAFLESSACLELISWDLCPNLRVTQPRFKKNSASEILVLQRLETCLPGAVGLQEPGTWLTRHDGP